VNLARLLSVKLIGAAAGVLLVWPFGAAAAEPGEGTMACLSTVLLTDSKTVSVKPKDDGAYLVVGTRIIRRGVDYTFRKPDGTLQTIGIYIGATDSDRYQLVLRSPVPRDWYPSARATFIPPNITRYTRQDSPNHPLFGLWNRLAVDCKIDNLALNSPTP
jgi:hypothetical protein